MYSRYVQLATVREDNRPSNRTVVYRGFLNDTENITFITDRRSQKVEELRRRPYGEICWYFPETREQYRFSGSCIVVHSDGVEPSCHDSSSSPWNSKSCHTDPSLAPSVLSGARQKIWSILSDPGRAQFSWPAPRLPKDIGDFGSLSEDLGAAPGSDPESETAVSEAAARNSKEAAKVRKEAEEQRITIVPAEAPAPDSFSLVVLCVDEVDHVQLFENSRTLYKLATNSASDIKEDANADVDLEDVSGSSALNKEEKAVKGTTMRREKFWTSLEVHP